MEDKLSLYLNVINAYNPVVYPDKRKLTFISKKSGIPQAYVWDESKDEIELLGEFDDRIMSVYHSPSGQQTIVGMDYEGNEKQQFYQVDQKGNIKAIVLSPEHFNNFGGWSDDEEKIAYSSNRRNKGFFDIFVMDISTGKEQVAYEFDGNCTPVCWLDKNRSRIVISVQETNIFSTYKILDLKTQETQNIGPSQDKARYQSLVFSKDQQTGYILSDFERDKLALYSFSTQNAGELKLLASDAEWDIEEIKLSPCQNFLILNINTGGTSVLKSYNLYTKELLTLSGVPSGVIDSISWTTNQELFFALKSPLMPGDIWMYDIKTNTSARLTHFGLCEEIEPLLVEPEVCQFNSFDGLQVPYFYYSSEKKPKATVIYVHGGPESQIKAEFNPVIQYLVSKGFAVAAPNVRGSLGYGRKYIQLDDGRKRMDAVADLATLVDDLVETKSIDPNKIGVMGRSYGGFMVLAALTHYPNLWAAGVNIVGISHFKTFLENTGPWRRKLREYEYGILGVDDDFFEEIAPLNHLDRISAPLLVFHGRNDTRVPVSEAEQLTANMRKLEKDVKLIVFEDEGHQTDSVSNHITMNTLIADFFNKTL